MLDNKLKLYAFLYTSFKHRVFCHTVFNVLNAMTRACVFKCYWRESPMSKPIAKRLFGNVFVSLVKNHLFVIDDKKKLLLKLNFVY